MRFEISAQRSMGAALFVVTYGSISRLVTLAVRHDVSLFMLTVFTFLALNADWFLSLCALRYHLNPFYFLQTLHISTDKTVVYRPQTAYSCSFCGREMKLISFIQIVGLLF